MSRRWSKSVGVGIVWCNERYVFLKVTDNRGYDTITEVLGSEQQNFITVSDCFAAQLKLNTPDKQICLAHLLRECEGLDEKYNSQWAFLLKYKLEQIIQLTKNKKIAPYTVQILEEELLSILKRARGRAHEKVRVFRKRLFKLRSYIITCLRNRLVHPTNNMSVRALRSTKVKIRLALCLGLMKKLRTLLFCDRSSIQPFYRVSIPLMH